MLQTLGRSLINLIYPNTCVACGGELADGESQMCIYCQWDIPLTGYENMPDNHVVQIFAGRFSFLNACSYFYFRGGNNPYRRAIHRMKYSSRRDIAKTLGAAFGRSLSESELYKDIDLIVPIPLHWVRRISRGYNQSEDIAEGIASSMGLIVDARSVRRIRMTAQQAKLHKSKRWENVHGAFTVRNVESLRGKHILLVDDVLTTGSTIEACALEIIKRVPDVKLSIATLSVAERFYDKGASKFSKEDSFTD